MIVLSLFGFLIMASSVLQRRIVSGFAPMVKNGFSSKIAKRVVKEARRGYKILRWSDDMVRLSAISDELSNKPANSNVTTDFSHANGSNDTSSDLTAKQAQPQDEEMNSILAIDPRVVEIVVVEKDPDEVQPVQSSADLFRQLPFVSMFRGSANYIANCETFGSLMDTININVDKIASTRLGRSKKTEIKLLLLLQKFALGIIDLVYFLFRKGS